jgi:hypothetical protein
MLGKYSPVPNLIPDARSAELAIEHGRRGTPADASALLLPFKTSGLTYRIDLRG